ncbi:hypothetical protein [Kitasatospora cineracea]|uniref:hypothetical protein n=1 Tax=Kitasatospora cineracea TaxID=88074 RepID=UPI0036850BFC
MTDDQLTVLLDRACRGVASAVEAEQLRAAIAQLQQQAAKAADLHEGEEPYEHEHTVPTPGQWLWQWNRATPERRLAMAAHVLEQQERLTQYTWTERIELHERAEAAEQQLAELHAGEQPVPSNGIPRRPGEWITAWNAQTPAGRLQHAQRILDVSLEVSALHDRLAEVAKIADRFEAQPGYGGYYDAAMDAAISIREALQ